MSYQLVDADGYVADIATTSGLAALQQWAVSLEGAVNLKGFLGMGAALMTEELVAEVDALELPVDPVVRKTFLGLREALHNCDVVAIISNGLE